MRFKQIHLKNFGPFADRSIDFAELDGVLTAVTGENGAGKSTLLELLLGAVYRQLPTRGALISHAHGRDALLRVEIEAGGHAYSITHHADGLSRKTDVLLTCDGESLLQSSKVSALDAFVRAHLPPLDVLLVTQFAAQKSQGFVSTKPAERKSLLLRIRGVDKLEALASAARQQASEALVGANVKRGVLVKDRERAEDPVYLRGQLAIAGAQLEVAEAAAAQADEALTQGRAQVAAAEGEQQAYWRWKDQRGKLQARLATERARLMNLHAQLRQAEAVTARADRIREAARLVLLAERDEIALTGELAIVQADRTRQQGEARALEAKTLLVSNALTDCERRLVARPAVEEAAALLPVREAAIAALGTELELVRAQLTELQGRSEVGIDGRLSKMRTALVTISDGFILDPAGVASEAISHDDQLEREGHELRVNRKTASDQLDAAAKQSAAATIELIDLRGKAARKPELDHWAHQHAEKLAEAAALRDERSRHNAQAGATTVAIAALDQKIAEAQRRVAVNRPDANALAALEAATGKLEVLKQSVATAEQAVTGLEAEVLQLGAEPQVSSAPQLSLLVAQQKEAAQRVKEALALPGALQQRLQTAEAAAARLAQDETRVLELEQEAADWRRLAADLGKDGLQAALSDSVLPELVALTNTLLHSAFGPRFTVDVRSQKADASGSRLLETLDVMVIDSVKGREDLVETFSGGEEVIIAEGLSLALTILACRSSGSERCTLIRDEAGAALSPANGRAWISMLRRAVELVGADRLLFVTHSPAIAALADSRIEL